MFTVEELQRLVEACRLARESSRCLERMRALCGAFRELVPAGALAARHSRDVRPLLASDPTPDERGTFRPMGTVTLPDCGCAGPSADRSECDGRGGSTRWSIGGWGPRRANRRCREVADAIGDEVLRALRSLTLHHLLSRDEPTRGATPGRALLVVDSRDGSLLTADVEASALFRAPPRAGGLVADAVLGVTEAVTRVKASRRRAAAQLWHVPLSGSEVAHLSGRALDARRVVVEVWTSADEAARREEHGRLTARERDVVDQVVRGATNEEVARALGLSSETVKTHLGRIYRKTGLHGRTELTAWVLSGKAPAWATDAAKGRARP